MFQPGAYAFLIRALSDDVKALPDDVKTFVSHLTMWHFTPRRACAARGQVIAIGLENFLNLHFQKSTPTQEGFSSNLIASSTP